MPRLRSSRILNTASTTNIISDAHILHEKAGILGEGGEPRAGLGYGEGQKSLPARLLGLRCGWNGIGQAKLMRQVPNLAIDIAELPQQFTLGTEAFDEFEYRGHAGQECAAPYKPSDSVTTRGERLQGPGVGERAPAEDSDRHHDETSGERAEFLDAATVFVRPQDNGDRKQ